MGMILHIMTSFYKHNPIQSPIECSVPHVFNISQGVYFFNTFFLLINVENEGIILFIIIPTTPIPYGTGKCCIFLDLHLNPPKKIEKVITISVRMFLFNMVLGVAKRWFSKDAPFRISVARPAHHSGLTQPQVPDGARAPVSSWLGNPLN